MINSYPSIYNLGHSAIAELLKESVIVEEKIDGSQISFSVNEQGELSMRSKGAPLNLLAPEGMFKRGVEAVQAIQSDIRPNHVYRGEYLNSPRHNVLAYDRVPKSHIIIFDINNGLETYYSQKEKASLAADINMECVPVLFEGVIEDANQFRALLDRESCLGGQKIEGVVIKPASYNLFGRDKKVLMGKFVSESFRETHGQVWEKEHKALGSQDIIEILKAVYGTSARWQKALIHLKERGEITNELKDIGALMKEIPEDVLKECETEIKQKLFDWAWPLMRRKITHGLPEWYKEELLKLQFK